MDYCSSCRRHLNGALVCPGCGAYAPDIAPPAQYVAEPAEEIPASGAGASEAAMADASGSGASVGFEGTAPAGQGRAARRRQLARLKKHRRRIVAATAVALVGGGLTMAALPAGRPSAGHTHAAPPPEPVNTSDTPGAAATGSSSEQPDTRVARDPGTRPASTTGRERNTADAMPDTVGTDTARTSAGAARSAAPRSATERTAFESARETAQQSAPEPPGGATGVGTADDPAPAPPTASAPAAPAPETTAPASTERPGLVGTVVDGLLSDPSADEPASSPHVCLIGVCVG
ncbi:SCO2400 family protein [Streptomyces flavidovirens]